MAERDWNSFESLEEAKTAASVLAQKYKVSVSVRRGYLSELMAFCGNCHPNGWQGPGHNETAVWFVSWTPPDEVEFNDLLRHGYPKDSESRREKVHRWQQGYDLPPWAVTVYEWGSAGGPFFEGESGMIDNQAETWERVDELYKKHYASATETETAEIIEADKSSPHFDWEYDDPNMDMYYAEPDFERENQIAQLVWDQKAAALSEDDGWYYDDID